MIEANQEAVAIITMTIGAGLAVVWLIQMAVEDLQRRRK